MVREDSPEARKRATPGARTTRERLRRNLWRPVVLDRPEATVACSKILNQSKDLGGELILYVRGAGPLGAESALLP